MRRHQRTARPSRESRLRDRAYLERRGAMPRHRFQQRIVLRAGRIVREPRDVSAAAPTGKEDRVSRQPPASANQSARMPPAHWVRRTAQRAPGQRRTSGDLRFFTSSLANIFAQHALHKKCTPQSSEWAPCSVSSKHALHSSRAFDERILPYCGQQGSSESWWKRHASKSSALRSRMAARASCAGEGTAESVPARQRNPTRSARQGADAR